YEVNAYIFKELFLLSLIGAILGMPLGVLFHRFVMRMLNMEMIQFGLTILPMSYLYAFLLTMAFTVIVLILTVRPIKKIKMVESLKSVE
ncbi:MAG: FtsX-like permease family protein, partial [Clostridia bacterium]|nr:FtsX-like permease family protein [Clostridia bacterium]